MWAPALSGSSAMAFCAAVNAPAVSLIRISHWESWIQRTAVLGSSLMASRSWAMACGIRPARDSICAIT